MSLEENKKLLNELNNQKSKNGTARLKYFGGDTAFVVDQKGNMITSLNLLLLSTNVLTSIITGIGFQI